MQYVPDATHLPSGQLFSLEQQLAWAIHLRSSKHNRSSGQHCSDVTQEPSLHCLSDKQQEPWRTHIPPEQSLSFEQHEPGMAQESFSWQSCLWHVALRSLSQ